ncbi:MAG: helix-turn-helix transcriptional regulator [Pseudomonadales bacterium]
MKHVKKKALEKAGWKIGSVGEFLELSDEEAAYLEMRLLLVHKLRSLRERKKISQVELAKMIGSSQSRIAKIEAGDMSVSTDLILKAILALGATRTQIAKTLGSTVRNVA